MIQCPVWGTREPPAALVQLSGHLKSLGIDTRCFDLNNHLYRRRSDEISTMWAWEQSMSWYDGGWVRGFFGSISKVIDEFTDAIAGCEPGLAAFSVSASTYHASCFMADMIKRRRRGIKVIFGGPAFLDPGYIGKAFSDSPADFLAIGDGETILPALIRALDTGGPIESCPGLYYRKGKRSVYTGDAGDFSLLDKMAFMDYSDLKIEDYDDAVHVAMMSSRGCVWKCAYCSTRAFARGYRAMSAERIHQEITYHRICNFDAKRKDNLGHIDFMDLEFNGRMDRVKEFCRLMIDYPPCAFLPQMKWVANAIIHPDLDRDMLQMIKDAGCRKLIFGIETGSERVLKLMKKPYSVNVAKRIIKDAFEAGLEVTTNFMFGFPGETEEDFQKTLDFVKEVGKYIERVYPSRTYCAVEQFSYMQEHLEEFGIKPPVNHHLYWETADGTNTYPVRLERCSRFEELCSGLGVKVDCGVKTSVEMDNWYNLGHYYEYGREYAKAAEYFLKYLEKDPKNEIVLSRVKAIRRQQGLTSVMKKELEKYVGREG